MQKNVTDWRLKKDKAKVEGVKEQLKGVADFAVGRLFGNKDRELRGPSRNHERFKQKDRADWQDNVRKGANDPNNPSND
jgi:uncharacterized protein YjbJ (UPF0337 family)